MHCIIEFMALEQVQHRDLFIVKAISPGPVDNVHKSSAPDAQAARLLVSQERCIQGEENMANRDMMPSFPTTASPSPTHPPHPPPFQHAGSPELQVPW